MLKLMRNEYQKIFTKKGTYVMLVLVIIIAAGFQFLLSNVTIYDYSYTYDKTDIESTLEWYKEMRSENQGEASNVYEMYVSFYEAMLDLEVYDAENGYETQSWQGSALNNAYYSYYTIIHDTYSEGYSEEEKADAQIIFDAIIESVRNNDHTAYYRIVLDNFPEDSYDYLRSSIILELGIVPTADDWRTGLVDDLISAKMTLDHYQNIDEADYDEAYYSAEETYELINYRLANNIEYCVTDSTSEDYDMLTGEESDYTFSSAYWYNIYNGSSMITLVTIMMIVIAGGIIASEFSQGTIKFLLLNPVKRSKIFFSKYFTLLTLTALLSIGLFCVNLLTNLFSGADGTGAVYLTYSDGAVVSRNILCLVIVPYLFSLVNAVVIITLAFMISSIMRSSAVSIGISVGVLLVGNTATAILAELGLDWGRYLIFANTDLFSVIHHTSLFPHHSLTFAIINIIVYMVVFLLTAYDGFTRKEV